MRKPDLSTRIAITGAGIICSIGRNKAEVWTSIAESRAGIGKLKAFPGESFPT
jgi:3-oxoacyl-(acyl-carrier-protein) synthase